jgi:hypothetical protein
MREWYWLLSFLLVLGIAWEIVRLLFDGGEENRKPVGMGKPMRLALMLCFVGAVGWAFSAAEQRIGRPAYGAAAVAWR